jgi:ABC-type oligopeptide transport system ATPase subunit
VDYGPLLAVNNLEVQFNTLEGVVHAVNGVSFNLEEGKTLGIVGESGCGKTTLGRVILRLVKPSSGRIFFDGNEITQLTQHEMVPLRRRMQMIFQDPYGSLNPRMNLFEIVGEPLLVNGLASRKQRTEQVAELLQLVGLRPEYMQRFPHPSAAASARDS